MERYGGNEGTGMRVRGVQDQVRGRVMSRTSGHPTSPVGVIVSQSRGAWMREEGGGRREDGGGWMMDYSGRAVWIWRISAVGSG